MTRRGIPPGYPPAGEELDGLWMQKTKVTAQSND